MDSATLRGGVLQRASKSGDSLNHSINVANVVHLSQRIFELIGSGVQQFDGEDAEETQNTHLQQC